ncbi:MAG TPA: cytochrome c, partial [Bacteroidia bacterium]|nr:cytochrome c [Bacteroidia bacterium]
MKRFIIILIASMLITLSANSQDGASIFKKNCAVCHTIGKGKIVGPDLIGMDKKHDIKWLIKWVKSSQSLVKKNDPKAVQIFNDNNKMIMPDQALTDDEVKAVVAFVSEETTKLEQPPVVSSPPVAIPN